MTSLPNPPRVVLAKVGLDGHDRGIKVVAHGLRDGGFHVIYAGLWQTPEAVIRTVADEDADWFGLSILSGTHMTLVPRVLQLLREADLENVGVLIGGIIPEGDIPKLLAMGVARVFGPGTALPDIVAFLRERSAAVMLDDLLDRFRRHDRLALSRLLSLLAHGEAAETILARVGPPSRTGSRVIAITGSGGVGKSTLVGKLIERFRAKDQTVAVLACDPQSPLSGGALLGDRFRMPNQPDEGIFIRSLAATSGHGALAEHVAAMVRLLEVFGFEIILIETVGAGQGDTAVHELADVVLLLLQPEAGDDLQWEKAGVMEIADIVAIHKADLPGAEQAEAQVKAALNLVSSGRAVPVLRASGRTGEGIEELIAVIKAQPLRRLAKPGDDQALLRLAQQAIAAQFATAEAAPDCALAQLITRRTKAN